MNLFGAEAPPAAAAPAAAPPEAENLLHLIYKIWHFPIAEIDKQPLTVSSLVIGVILLLIGIKVSRTLSNQFGKKVLPRFHMEQGATSALQSLAYYALLILSVLFAMSVTGIPFTALTVIGGAVAIGIGFGSQNIVANFISGLILLIERPIRVGDMVEVEGHAGLVKHIGARSTQIKTFTGVDIIVPNSFFLEKAVVNWTYDDDMSWTTITVGVAYGSPAEDVAKLLMRAAEAHDKVIKDPFPFVNFSDFGDNALIFKLSVALKMRSLKDRADVESDLRFTIERLFRDNAISMPYPQRDVHFDTTKPLEVRIAH
jgi:small-conductance mechanosensitive channel